MMALYYSGTSTTFFKKSPQGALWQQGEEDAGHKGKWGKE